MAEKRKLLNEMDKCFKKIEEGVELFEETMSKMQEANSENQREKFQDDLKKEIKKLQRLRDQIKGWQNSSDIKDKDRLTHYRKVIEQRMEQFKDIERENKTKPHSKMGLSAEEKLDPKEKEKVDTIEWCQLTIRELEDECDKMESHIESLSTVEQTRKKGKKDDGKKGEKERQKKLEDLRKRHDRAKFHVSKLEVCMRLIDNETLDCTAVVDSLKDPFDAYIEALKSESGKDPESVDPESTGMYEEFDLLSFTPLGGAIFGTGDAEEKIDNTITEQKTLPDESPTPAVTPKEVDESTKQRHASGESAVVRTVPTTRSSPATPLKISNHVSTENSLGSPPPPATPPPPPPGIPYNVAAGHGTKSTKPNLSHNSNVKSVVDIVRQPAGIISITTTTTTSSVAQPAGQKHNDENALPNAMHVDVPSVSVSQAAPQNLSQFSRSTTPELNAAKVTLSTSAQQEVSAKAAIMPTTDMNSVPTQTVIPYQQASPTVVTPSGVALNDGITSNLRVQLSSALSNEIDSSTYRHLLRNTANDEKFLHKKSAIIPAWLGASPLGRLPPQLLEPNVPLLESAVNRLPLPMDSEKPRSYLPKMPCATAEYYPKSPPCHADTLEYYLKLSPETLFFAFYYLEGSRAQLLAARALKRLSWRFHTKHLMWFQRHEEPKYITDDYEQGTYIYFDYEKWAQRKKEQFTFEYRYLEDKDFD